ncbi:hypothetical protein [Nocardiopsis gilva]|uniref:hypothetical protein n=1 Tax=Nocardiopsis gilva TaxID=280236 RepID=UPI0039EF4211
MLEADSGDEQLVEPLKASTIVVVGNGVAGEGVRRVGTAQRSDCGGHVGVRGETDVGGVHGNGRLPFIGSRNDADFQPVIGCYAGH